MTEVPIRLQWDATSGLVALSVMLALWVIALRLTSIYRLLKKGVEDR